MILDNSKGCISFYAMNLAVKNYSGIAELKSGKVSR